MRTTDRSYKIRGGWKTCFIHVACSHSYGCFIHVACSHSYGCDQSLVLLFHCGHLRRET